MDIKASVIRSFGSITLWFILALSPCFGQKFQNLALTPPMGWNSWNRFECDISEKIIRDAADAMVASGMKEAGYEYIVIDDCWQIGRDSLGFVVADPEKFPSGMKALADYVHAKGLKFGIYSCAGRETCQNRPGSRGYEYQDALMYASWGVDYLKHDWCYTDGQNAQESYTLMRDALYAAGRPMVFSMCEWGLNKPWEWAQDVSHIWRTTGDIRNNWDVPDAKEGKCWGGGVIINLDMQQGLEEYAGPGHWNDPDMLQVGNGGLTESESRAHFSLWCMLAAPLMAGNDLSTMDATTKTILTNKEAIAINQDALGKQGFKVKDWGEFEVYYKPLAGGDVALCLFNRFNEKIGVEMNWQTMECTFTKNKKPLVLKPLIDRKDVQLKDTYTVQDVWNKKNVSMAKNLITEIPAHDVVLLQLSKQ